MKNQKSILLLLVCSFFSILSYGQEPINEDRDSGPITIIVTNPPSECSPDEEGVFNHVKIAGDQASVLDLHSGNVGGWTNQIRFWNACEGEGTKIQHIIASHEGRERLVIIPGFSGNGDDVMEVWGKITVGTSAAPDVLPSGEALENYKLFVAGGILAQEIRVVSSFADYVFYDDYKLRPLSEVSTFIDKNGHLPGVSTAAEIEMDGMNVAEITVQQQEKIEELFLYILEMEERLKNLEKENDSLQQVIQE